MLQFCSFFSTLLRMRMVMVQLKKKICHEPFTLVDEHKLEFRCYNCVVLRSKTHKRLKERILIGRNRTKRANFRGSPLFQATYKTNKQNRKKKKINSTYLVSVGCGRLAEGKGHCINQDAVSMYISIYRFQ